MKIALLGNTCNNNFAIMRYFRNLGVSADLFLYSNEANNLDNPIHNPSWDTWNIDNWSMFIKKLSIPNGIESIIGRPDLIRTPPNLDEIKYILSEYDYFIGSGITPSLFWRINKKMDIFYPYSTGIEWVMEGENQKKLKRLNFEWPFRKYIYYTQLSGIRNAKKVLLGENGLTASVLLKHNIAFENFHPPIYYKENIPEKPPNALLEKIVLKSKESNFNIFSFVRHSWIYKDAEYLSEKQWSKANKHNDWLIKGYAKFIKKIDNKKSILFLSLNGRDVMESKKLIHELGISNRVCWLPLLARKEVSFLLKKVAHLGVGQFVNEEGEAWGATGWECIASGIPFMASINYSEESFKNLFGFNLPPHYLNVRTEEDVYDLLLECYFNLNLYGIDSLSNSDWFDKNSSINQAKKMLNLLIEK